MGIVVRWKFTSLMGLKWLFHVVWKTTTTKKGTSLSLLHLNSRSGVLAGCLCMGILVRYFPMKVPNFHILILAWTKWQKMWAYKDVRSGPNPLPSTVPPILRIIIFAIRGESITEWPPLSCPHQGPQRAIFLPQVSLWTTFHIWE